jgi:hypothetical protein
MNSKFWCVSKGSRIFLSFIFCFSVSLVTRATVCNSSYSGDWNNGVWSCGAPNCGDTLVIQASHTITINSQQDYTGCSSPMCIYIYGTLKFVTGNKLRLPCGSMIYVMSGGSIQAGGSGGGSSNYIEICNNISWSSASGPLYGPSCVGCAPLSVELISFTGNFTDKKVQLSWITATEKDIHHFEVERSGDATHFTPVALIESKSPQGNSSEKLQYLIFDNDPVSPGSYYRLKEVDKNSVSEYSKTVYVDTRKSDRGICLYPNPNNGNFIIHLGTAERNKLVELKVHSADGFLAHDLSFLSGGEDLTEFEITLGHDLKPGVYFLTLSIDSETSHSKMIVR